MRDIKILLTAAGCPGASTLIRMLKNNGERNIEIIGVDMNPYAIGKFMCDKFYTVPAANDEEKYISRLKEIMLIEKPDILFPQSSAEVHPISKHKKGFEFLGAKVLVASSYEIEVCNDKAMTYRMLEGTGVPLPRTYYPKNMDEFLECSKLLGYPEKDICFKPNISKGSRGFRIISSRINRAHLILNERPNNLYITMEDFIDIFKDEKFPLIMLMEYVEGNEFTVDAFSINGEMILRTAKTRDSINTGLAMAFKTIDRSDLIEYSKKIVEKIRIDYYANIQFKGDKLLEINPRVSTFVYQDDFNIPYLGIKYLLGELSSNELREYNKNIKLSRRTIRYYDQVFWDCEL